jgi:hypothetical protein
LRGKRHVLERRKPLLTDQLQPSTNADKLSDLGLWLPKGFRWGEQVQKPLICMHFHGVLLGRQHEIWSKQHNGKVSIKVLKDKDLEFANSNS